MRATRVDTGLEICQCEEPRLRHKAGLICSQIISEYCCAVLGTVPWCVNIQDGLHHIAGEVRAGQTATCPALQRAHLSHAIKRSQYAGTWCSKGLIRASVISRVEVHAEVPLPELEKSFNTSTQSYILFCFQCLFLGPNRGVNRHRLKHIMHQNNQSNNFRGVRR